MVIEREARRWSAGVPDAEQIVVAARRQQTVVAVRQAAHLLRVLRQALRDVLCRSCIVCMDLKREERGRERERERERERDFVIL